MKKIFLLIFLLITVVDSQAYAQQDSIISSAENFLINQEFDSVKVIIPEINGEENERIKSLLDKIVNQENVSYEDYQKIVERLYTNKVTTPVLLSQFIEAKVLTPTSGKINYHYVLVKWMEINWLLNENELDRAALVQHQFENYVSKFNANERDVKRAMILIDSYHLVICQIESSKEMALEILKRDVSLANEVKDTNLLILLRFFEADFLIDSGDLDKFIKLSEESLILDAQMSKHSYFYQPTVLHLIDAYFYKGGKEKEALALLDELYQNPNTRKETYSYYPAYVGNIEIPSPESEAVFDKFGATDLVGFAYKILDLTEGKVNSNEYYYTLFSISKMFEKQHDLENAILYVRESNIVIKRIYRTELAESLAANKTSLLQQKQELELAKEQEKTNMYLIITVLTGLITVLTVSYLLLRRNKERLLELKNDEITVQRDEIKKKDGEKALLLKEIHHRVKNNFQVVSSLLELQSVGIEDEKARALAIESKNRINSMALIHKKLYENDDLQMFFDEYVNKLVNDLSSMYGYSENVRVMVNVPHISFDIDTAIPLGLIINELTSNSFKYGMTNEEPLLEVSIQETGSNLFLLHVRDNGNGLPNDFSLNKLNSLGLQLVKGLSRQLMGELTFDTDNGTHMYVTFKCIHAKRMNG